MRRTAACAIRSAQPPLPAPVLAQRCHSGLMKKTKGSPGSPSKLGTRNDKKLKAEPKQFSGSSNGFMAAKVAVDWWSTTESTEIAMQFQSACDWLEGQ